MWTHGLQKSAPKMTNLNSSIRVSVLGRAGTSKNKINVTNMKVECEKNSKKVTISSWLRIMQRLLLLPIKFSEKVDDIEDPRTLKNIQLELTKKRKSFVLLFDLFSIVVSILCFIAFQVKIKTYFLHFHQYSYPNLDQF